MPDPPRDGVPSRLADLFEDVLPEDSSESRGPESRGREPFGPDPDAETSFAGLVDDEDAPQREGLPSGYRMRHDAQFVRRLSEDESTPRLKWLEIESVAAPEGTEQASSPIALEQLIDSIRDHGVLQPILVRPSHDRFALIDGRARLAAARQAGLRHVPCLVFEVGEDRARELAQECRVQQSMRPGGSVERAATSHQEIAASLQTVLSCVEAIHANPGRLLGRAGLDIITAETKRALWFVEAQDAMASSSVTPLPVDAASLLEREIENLEPEAKLLGVFLRSEIRDRTLTTWADETLLRVALAGMLRTAMGLLGEGPGSGLSVRFGRWGDHRLQIEVAQTPGPFTQLEGAWALESLATRSEGQPTIALALRMARRIAELHEGAIDLLEGERGGFSLRLSLPAAVLEES